MFFWIDAALFISCILVLLASLYLTYKTKFIQIRCFPLLFKMLVKSPSEKSQDVFTITPIRALFTAMSTTLGIGTIVAPVVAIQLGGPGALLGFLITSFFGSAATYLEVNLAINHRKRAPDGSILGGPMQYIEAILSKGVARWYALCCFILMTAWSGAQANQLSAILSSPLLEGYQVAKPISGFLMACGILVILMGGIKRIGSFSAKLVPVMFTLYLGSILCILGLNLDKFPIIFGQIFGSVFSPYQMATGAVVGGLVAALRWGVFKGIQANEAGVGTQSIPHSMAETKDPESQGALAMLSTYTAGIIAFLTGCVVLITETWQDPALPLGINMIAGSFKMYFSHFGILIVTITTLLFAFGTTLGNCYNGSQCFGYITNNKWIKWYYFAAAIMIFIGSIAEVKTFWSLIDIVLACMILPHIATLVVYAFKKSPSVDEVLEKGYDIKA